MKTNKKIKEQAAKRRFRGMPVREAKHSLKVQPLQEDIDQAKRGDPSQCVYALCLKRVLHTDSVFIYKGIAYVGALDEKGNRIFERYIINRIARRVIDTLDQKGNEHLVPAGFTFHPPPKSGTLDYALKNEKRPPRASRDRKIKGSRIVSKTKPKQHPFSYLRSGTGMVQFIAKQEDEKMTTREKKHAHDITTTN